MKKEQRTKKVKMKDRQIKLKDKQALKEFLNLANTTFQGDNIVPVKC